MCVYECEIKITRFNSMHHYLLRRGLFFPIQRSNKTGQSAAPRPEEVTNRFCRQFERWDLYFFTRSVLPKVGKRLLEHGQRNRWLEWLVEKLH